MPHSYFKNPLNSIAFGAAAAASSYFFIRDIPSASAAGFIGGLRANDADLPWRQTVLTIQKFLSGYVLALCLAEAASLPIGKLAPLAGLSASIYFSKVTTGEVFLSSLAGAFPIILYKTLSLI